ncbi:hypothetical protein ACPCBX_08475 [Streptomyces tuirus]|uniref:Uncharacterized protein n=1 Tax=Streptomyces tuirus TaxID=68278 RepID=A0A7G1NAX5_9ACTN|nr:hypothetical protein [Streptomyces tuirus]BCL18714.1 hypothetical protein GCM10017668_05570 [Streptomyces tuirus]
MLRVSSRLRVGGAFGYLLLVAALTFGVFAMHTMGHPEHSSGSGAGGASHTVAATHQDAMGRGAAETGTSTEPVAMAEHGAVAPTEPTADGPLAGMDVLSVCVAVLTGWLLWPFLGAAARRKERLTALLARAMAVLRPRPPPPRPLLAQLSVLRI